MAASIPDRTSLAARSARASLPPPRNPICSAIAWIMLIGLDHPPAVIEHQGRKTHRRQGFRRPLGPLQTQAGADQGAAGQVRPKRIQPLQMLGLDRSALQGAFDAEDDIVAAGNAQAVPADQPSPRGRKKSR